MVRPQFEACNENENVAVGLKRGAWSPQEDKKLLAHIQQHGHATWRALPHKAGLQRCGKSCRLRWSNYLRPDIKRGQFSLQEEDTIIQLHALLGNRWSAIAAHLGKRTDNETKNYWNAHLKKKLSKMGIDSITHKFNTNPNLNHMAQWETARIQAEAAAAVSRRAQRHVDESMPSTSSIFSNIIFRSSKLGECIANVGRTRFINVVVGWYGKSIMHGGAP